MATQKHTNGSEFDSTSEVGIQISDEEGLVDKKTKEHIINLRIQIDNDERELFVEKATDPDVKLHPQEAVHHWTISVKQYLRAIKRLWHDESPNNEVKNVDYYWNEKQIGDGYTLIPPDKNGYEFSLIAQPGITEKDLRKMLDLPRDEQVPKPEPVIFEGLQEVLNSDKISHTWTVYTSKRGAPPNWEKETLVNERPLPKELLEDAVETADDFLQQAGIGFKIGDDLPSWGYDEMKGAREDDDVEVI